MRTRRTPMMLLAIPAALLLWAPAESRAQGFGMGFGHGGMWGFGGFRTVPSPTDFLNQHALVNAKRAGRPPSNSVYAGNPNSYVNRVRDNSFTPRYDVRRRSPGTSRVPAPTTLAQAPAANQAAVAAAAAVDSTARAIAPLASFFNASRELVWPADSPISGDLKPKRDLSDEASLLVFNEVDRHGRAPIALAADARQRLLDYGRPALQEIRETAAPSVADGFHAFLRSLYDSLSASTDIPPPPPTR